MEDLHQYLFNRYNCVKCKSVLIFFLLSISCNFFSQEEESSIQIDNDSSELNLPKHIVGFSTFAVKSTNPSASFHLYKAKFAYSNFLTPFFQLNGSITLYNAWSNFNAFDKRNMFNVDITGRLYWRKFHLDLGIHPGNYAEFIEEINNRPKFILYGSFGGGINFPIAKKLTLDLEFRKLYSLNRFPKYDGPNPFEMFIGMSYLIHGNNDCFRSNKVKFKITNIQARRSHWIGYGFLGGAFRWPTDEGNRITYIINSYNYSYMYKRHVSFTGTILHTFLTGADSTVNGFNRKHFNTVNVGIGAKYHLGPMYFGSILSIGSFSAFKDDFYMDRKTRAYINPELGVNARLSKTLLLEFQVRYNISMNALFNKLDPSKNFFIGSLGIKKKLNFKR
jgi:hypothetical protein